MVQLLRSLEYRAPIQPVSSGTFANWAPAVAPSQRGIRAQANRCEPVEASREFSNTSPRTKSLVSAVLERSRRRSAPASRKVFEDSRGPNVTTLSHRQVRLSESQRRAILQDWKGGLGTLDVAAKHGVSRQTVWRITSRAKRLAQGESAARKEKAIALDAPAA